MALASSAAVLGRKRRSPIWYRDLPTPAADTSPTVTGSQASIAMRAAGIGDRRRHGRDRGLSSMAFAVRSVAYAVRSRPASRTGRRCAEMLCPPDGMVSDLIEVVLTSLDPFLRGCRAPERRRGEPAQDLGRPRSFTLRAYRRRTASVFAAADLEWSQCSAASSCRRGRFPVVLAASNRGASRERPAMSIAASPGFTLRSRRRPGPGRGCAGFIAVGGGDVLRVAERGLAFPTARLR